jgi:hypothetical protein
MADCYGELHLLNEVPPASKAPGAAYSAMPLGSRS